MHTATCIYMLCSHVSRETLQIKRFHGIDQESMCKEIEMLCVCVYVCVYVCVCVCCMFNLCVHVHHHYACAILFLPNIPV